MDGTRNGRSNNRHGRLLVGVMLVLILFPVLFIYWFTGTTLIQADDPVPVYSSSYSHYSKTSNSRKRSPADGKWVSFQFPYEMYVYTAFLDKRESIGSPTIRVITVMETLNNKHKEHDAYCYFKLSSGELNHVKATFLPIGIYWSSKDGKKFKENILSCPLQHKAVPSHVSIVPSPDVDPTFSIPVEVPERKQPKDNFIVCVPVIFWHHDPYRIVEWMEYLKIFGVSKVALYNNSLDYESTKVFQYYEKSGFVELRNSHTFRDESYLPSHSDKIVNDARIYPIRMHSSPVINDCMYRNMHLYKNVISIDLDELIVPRMHWNYTDMINYISSKQQRFYKQKSTKRNFVFRNAYFFTDFGRSPNESRHLTTLSYQTRLPPSGPGYSVKSIVSIQACTNLHNHYCWGSTKVDHEEVNVDPAIGLNQHYKRCHFDVYNGVGKCNKMMKDQIHDDVMLRFKPRLIPQVEKALKDLGIDSFL